MKHLADGIKIVGLLLHICGYRITRRKVLIAVYVLNTLLSVPYLLEITERFGLDYSSYLQQMSAVYQG
jgi:hypothetical protein